jgi:hypothetical protein
MVNWVKVIMNAQNNATNLVTKVTGCGCQQGAWFLTWVRDNNVHTCTHTGSETHLATYPVVCREVSAVHKTPRLRMCGVQWRQQHSLIHSLTHSWCALISSTKKGFFLDGNTSSLDTATLEVQTTTVSDNVGHHSTSDRVAHPRRTVASRHADWHIREVSTHPRGF